MNSSKLIDISKSSIVGLKAELLKKQEEVKRLKELHQSSYIKPEIVKKKKSVQEKSNDGIEKRCAKDNDAVEEDYDALQQSREVLETKARLYEKLKGNSADDQTKTKYLIDFDLKREIDKEAVLSNAQKGDSDLSENEEDYSDPNSDPENDWVDFVDTLGRSRRCLRKDLPEMKAKDAKLVTTIRPPSPPPEPTPTTTPELLSWDMQREMMRQKWEEQETQLLGKKDIHYQDIRFDEARPHGVGYFDFSTDEAERARQQEELQKLRAQTQQQQEAARGLRARREQQLQARLAAARRRRRERLGLPPESPPREVEISTIEEEQKEHTEEESIVDLEESVRKIAPVRPWDIGKDGVAPVMSQEEWIEKKRQERPEEFAPPSSLNKEIKTLEDSAEQKWKSNPNVFTSKKTIQQSLKSEKHKKKRKKSKRKKAKEDGLVEEIEDDEGDTFGPSVKDWQNISKMSETVSSNNLSNETSNLSTQYDLKHSQVMSGNTADPRTEELPRPSVQGWKPTMSDIDLLLSKSRETNSTPASFTSSSVEDKRHQNISQDLTVMKETMKLKSVYLKDVPSSSSYLITNTVETTCNNIPVHAKRMHQEGSYQRSESLNEHPETVIKPIVNLMEVVSDDEEAESSNKSSKPNTNNWKGNKRKFAEIPPPPSMSYYIDADKKNIKHSSKPELADSISAGISYLKSQTEEKSKKRIKGMLDII